MAMSAEDRFNTELLKLLLQVAWSDGEVEEKETLMFLSLGRSWSVPEAELTVLRDRLAKGDPLPSPDLGLLRSRPDDVLEAARAFILADSKVKMDEHEMLEQIKELMGVQKK